MLDLGFEVVGADVERGAMAPTLRFHVRVREGTGAVVHSALLRARIQIEARRRRYDEHEQARLVELFGEPDRWSDTLRVLPWAQAAVVVPGFTGSVEVDIPVACTYDMEIGSTKYLHGLEGGDVPLLFLFNGTVFARGPAGLSVEQLSWDLEASWRMPIARWHRLMDAYFPDANWIRLGRDRFDALARYKAERALPTWEAVVDDLLADRLAPPVA